MNGWILLHKKILEWEWASNKNAFRLFIFLLLLVNYEDKKWNGITVKKGQLITSIPHLSAITGLSIQQTRNSQNILKSTGEITVKVTNKYRIITIPKYGQYQKPTDKPTDKQQTNQHQLKNIRNKEYILSSNTTPNMRYDYSADWNKEKKIDPLKGEIDRILGAFEIQYKKDIGDKMYPFNLPLARKSVKNALKTYKENEIIELMPVFFSNEFYRNTGWAVWTMMSGKVLNQLKNG